MTLRDVCEREECGHARESHYSEIQSSGDVNQERRRVYFGCLASFCECERFVASKK
jgi:hypothetical protein